MEYPLHMPALNNLLHQLGQNMKSLSFSVQLGTLFCHIAALSLGFLPKQRTHLGIYNPECSQARGFVDTGWRASRECLNKEIRVGGGL